VTFLLAFDAALLLLVEKLIDHRVQPAKSLKRVPLRSRT
jgi:hypothetical protein